MVTFAYRNRHSLRQVDFIVTHVKDRPVDNILPDRLSGLFPDYEEFPLPEARVRQFIAEDDDHQWMQHINWDDAQIIDIGPSMPGSRARVEPR